MKKVTIISDIEKRTIDVTLFEYDCNGEITETVGAPTEFNFEAIGCFFDRDRCAYVTDDIDTVIDTLKSWAAMDFDGLDSMGHRRHFDPDDIAFIEEYGYRREVKIEEV